MSEAGDTGDLSTDKYATLRMGIDDLQRELAKRAATDAERNGSGDAKLTKLIELQEKRAKAEAETAKRLADEEVTAADFEAD